MTASTHAFIAATRFGLGPAPGELQRIGGDPRGWLEGQLATRPELPAALAHQPKGSERMAMILQARRQRGDAGVEQLVRADFRQMFVADAGARIRAQIDSEAPFRERLVAFWSNHFTVSVQRPQVLGLAEAFEREAIRPRVTGRFHDMLVAVARHPAMLVYLDNANSIGPNSRAGRNRNRGLNENLAREILELHTLGVTAGYTQGDVGEFAKILTGWSLARAEDQNAGQYHFNPFTHEPGDKVLLGKRYGESGEEEGLAALRDLARHPATARHIATKLARHFVADKPPDSAITRLERVFRDSDGDLGAVSRALIVAPEPWAQPLTKLKSPHDFVVSAHRATGYRAEAVDMVRELRGLGQTPFAAPSPAGWPDEAEKWIGPESVLRRAEWALALAGKVASSSAPLSLMAATIAPVASRETQLAIERAPSAVDAVALLLASPEFQRR